VFDVARHKAKLRSYFDGVGFERWSAIYGQGELTGVRRSVREGHSTMLDHVQSWLAERALPEGATVLDAGCGTGLFSLAMAQQGFRVTAVDIAPQMVQAAQQRAQELGVQDNIDFITGDLESVGGSYDAVVCLDVLIHYPRPAFDQLCSHLASLSRGELIITYAPHNPALALMHHIGGFFPRSQRRTDIQMIRDGAVQQILAQAGWQVQRSTRVSCGFYHVALLEAEQALEAG
jgi:magnesium-protoporphyrin O-methyltransferase